jgi:protein-disulfide isomerase
MSKPQPKKSSGAPVMIIISVAVVAVVLGLFYWNSSRTITPTRNTNTGVNATPRPVATANPNAPPGANPPEFLGPQNAAVTVEEFADFQCPSCGAVHPTMKQLQGMFGSRVKFIFRNFPLPMHDKAYDAAVAAEAAGLQGSEKFWAMHNLLYTNQRIWSVDPNYKATFKDYASKIGLDVDKWENDISGMAARGRVQADIERGKALNVSSTPTIYINGKSVAYEEMNVPTMQKMIEDELKAVQSPQTSSSTNTGTTASANNSNTASNK